MLYVANPQHNAYQRPVKKQQLRIISKTNISHKSQFVNALVSIFQIWGENNGDVSEKRPHYFNGNSRLSRAWAGDKSDQI